MKLIIDMNLSPNWVQVLKEGGIEAIHWSELGAQDSPDATILAYALEHQCIVLTHDLDFSAILASTNIQKPSVVQIRSTNVSAAAIGKQVIAALIQMTDELADGALVTVEPQKTRLRLLPFRR
jgi:predicted nuclease of predicted toxin-antitoxin system